MAESLPFTMTTIADVVEWIDAMMGSATDHHDHGLTDIERARNGGKADAFRVTRILLLEVMTAGQRMD